MRWAIVFGFLVLGCTEQGPPSVPQNPGSGVGEGGGRGGSGGFDGGTDGGAGGSADGGEPKGACDNESDLDALAGVSDDPREIARVCGLPNHPTLLLCLNNRSYEDCITECVGDEVPGISEECAACSGALERCGVAQIPSCRTACQLNGCSSLCLDCLNRGDCIEDYETCRGLPGNGCPP